MAQELAVATAESDFVGLYLDVAPNELVDLEVAAAAAIEWARAIKAAAAAVDDSYEYRVNLFVAAPGSSKWLATVERSKPNQIAKQVVRGWQKVPLILRAVVALAVVIPGTAVPTIKFWLGDDKFSEEQIEQMAAMQRKVAEDAAVKAHREAMFGHLPRDRKITGVGAGLARDANWKPQSIMPANQFAEGGGLFTLQSPPNSERTISPELDVILVSPQLRNAAVAWTFRQEGIPGTFKATMKDKRFLAALERSAVRETLRADIPMRIRLEVKQTQVDGEWKVKSRGRSVVEVLSPAIE